MQTLMATVILTLIILLIISPLIYLGSRQKTAFNREKLQKLLEQSLQAPSLAQRNDWIRFLTQPSTDEIVEAIRNHCLAIDEADQQRGRQGLSEQDLSDEALAELGLCLEELRKNVDMVC